MGPARSLQSIVQEARSGKGASNRVLVLLSGSHDNSAGKKQRAEFQIEKVRQELRLSEVYAFLMD